MLAPIVTATEATISHGGAAPGTIRAGIVIGAVIGMNAETCASVPSGSSRTAKPAKNETRIIIVSGVCRLQLLLARDQRARAGERAGVERVAEHEPDERERDGAEQRAVDVERAGDLRGRRARCRPSAAACRARAGRARSPCPPAGPWAGSWPAGPRSRARPSPRPRPPRPSSRRSAAGRRASGSRRTRRRPWRRGPVDRLDGRDLERRRLQRPLRLLGAQPGLLERVGGSHLAVGDLQQRHELVVRLLLGADLAVVTTASSEPSASSGVRDGPGLSTCWPRS